MHHEGWAASKAHVESGPYRENIKLHTTEHMQDHILAGLSMMLKASFGLKTYVSLKAELHCRKSDWQTKGAFWHDNVGTF